MDDNRRSIKISSTGARRSASAGRSAAPQRRSASRPTQPAKPQSKRPAKKSGLSVQTALIIAIAAVIVICVPLIIFATSSVSKGKELPENNDTVLVAPATAVPGESSTVAVTTPDPDSSATPAPEEDTSSFKRGDENAEIARIQQRLMELGYMEKAEPTELFGPATEEAVKLFQDMNDLTSDGVATADTQSKLFSDRANAFVLSEGANSLAVSQLQSRLRELGYLDANSTAYYGTATVDAVKRFQQQNDLDADGKVGISTWTKIFSSDAAKAKKAEPTAAPAA